MKTKREKRKRKQNKERKKKTKKNKRKKKIKKIKKTTRCYYWAGPVGLQRSFAPARQPVTDAPGAK
jgi:hypothetical protein